MNNDALKIYLFYCSNSLKPAEIVQCCSEIKTNSNSYRIKTISLPCSGKLDLLYLIKAFETGADGAVIVTCKLNECRSFEGNLRARKRAEAVDSLLEEIGMGSGRMAVIHLKDEGIKQVITELKLFCSKIRNLPRLRMEDAQLQSAGGRQ